MMWVLRKPQEHSEAGQGDGEGGEVCVGLEGPVGVYQAENADFQSGQHRAASRNGEWSGEYVNQTHSLAEKHASLGKETDSRNRSTGQCEMSLMGGEGKGTVSGCRGGPASGSVLSV